MDNLKDYNQFILKFKSLYLTPRRAPSPEYATIDNSPDKLSPLPHYDIAKSSTLPDQQHFHVNQQTQYTSYPSCNNKKPTEFNNAFINK